VLGIALTQSQCEEIIIRLTRRKTLTSLILAIMPGLITPCLVGCRAATMEDSGSVATKIRAPELEGGLGWLNTDKPLTLKQLRGKVVLLDFWTFCCINCMHILPELRKLEDKYPNELVVIGVHSAKFENEKDTSNIREAILRYGIHHPVINDADFKIWQAYTVHAWPTLVLIDPAGDIVGTTSGEGHFDLIDQAIQKTIHEFDAQGKLNHQPLNLVREKPQAETALAFPGKISADPQNKRLFVTDSDHNRIVAVDLNGRVLDIIGSGAQGAADGGFSAASFHHPQGVAFDGKDKLYVADTENHLIRVADFADKSVHTLAGTGEQAEFRAGGGQKLKTALNSPWDLVLIGRKLYIAMAGAHQIWLMELDRDSIQPFAGNGAENIVDGPLAQASLAQPSGLTTDGEHLYFADSEVSAVRKADLKPDGKVSTIIGKGLFQFGDRDGAVGQAKLQHPLGVLWKDNKLYVADSYNHKIKVIDLADRTIKTVAGTGKPGYVDGAKAQFSEPGGLCSLDNNLYVADTNNGQVRVIDLSHADAVSTFAIKNLSSNTEQISETQAASSKSSDSSKLGPDDKLVEVAPTDLKPSASGQIHIHVDLPKGYHLNADAPCGYSIKQSAAALDFGMKDHGTVKPPSLNIDIPFNSSATGDSTVSITVPVYFCSEGQSEICVIKNLVFRIPVYVTANASITEINATGSIPTPSP